jgi:hypothetical protein
MTDGSRFRELRNVGWRRGAAQAHLSALGPLATKRLGQRHSLWVRLGEAFPTFAFGAFATRFRFRAAASLVANAAEGRAM